MSDALAVTVVITATLYVAIAITCVVAGLLEYSIERGVRRRPEEMRKSARQIKCAIIWPILIPWGNASHFLEDLRRDMRRKR